MKIDLIDISLLNNDIKMIYNDAELSKNDIK